MLSSGEKRWLEEQFDLAEGGPSHLDEEEQKYWNALSDRWNHALLSLYERIAQQDK